MTTGHAEKLSRLEQNPVAQAIPSITKLHWQAANGDNCPQIVHNFRRYAR